MSPVAVGGIIYNNYGFVNNYNNYGFVNNESNPSKMGTLDPNIQEYGSYAVTIIYCEVPLRTWTCGIVIYSLIPPSNMELDM